MLFDVVLRLPEDLRNPKKLPEGILGIYTNLCSDVRTKNRLKREYHNYKKLKRVFSGFRASEPWKERNTFFYGCARCGGCKEYEIEPKTFLKCGKCKLAHYCSRECQKRDW